MILNEQNLIKVLKAPLTAGVYYYFSPDEYPVRSFAAKTVSLLTGQEGDAELTRLEGPCPSIEEAIAAAGMISFFGTKRIVELSMLDPTAMPESDIKDLCELMNSLENAVLVITSVFKDEHAMKAKKVKQLIEAAERYGVAAMPVNPGPSEIRKIAADKARELNTEISPAALSELMDRCGTELYALTNEIEKLAAMSSYTEITPELIRRRGTRNIDADVFEMIRLLTAGNKISALEKLLQLIELQNDPIAISAAMAGSFVDMYRVKCGSAVHRNYAAVFKDFAYKGKDYRLKMAGKSAAKYTQLQLEKILNVLLQTDSVLKSSAADKTVLLETALCEIMQIGERR